MTPRRRIRYLGAFVLVVVPLIGLVIMLSQSVSGPNQEHDSNATDTSMGVEAANIQESRVQDCATLLHSLRHHDDVTRSKSAEKLGECCADADETRAALLESLRDPAPTVRASVIWALGTCANDTAEEALKAIVGSPWKRLAERALERKQSLEHYSLVEETARIDGDGQVTCEADFKGTWITSNGVACQLVVHCDESRTDTVLIRMTLLNVQHEVVVVPRPMELGETIMTFISSNRTLRTLLQPIFISPDNVRAPGDSVLEPGESITETRAIRFGVRDTWPYETSKPDGIWAAWENRYTILPPGDVQIQIELKRVRHMDRTNNDDNQNMWYGVFRCQPLYIVVTDLPSDK